MVRFWCKMGGMISILILFACHVISVMGVRSGPFKSTYIRVEPCENPTLPMDQDPAASFFAELYNTTAESNLMRGHVTVHREHRIKKMKARSYLWVSNKWKVNYLINNMGCNRVFFPVLAMATGVKYDLKTCTLYKGVYAYTNFNVNKIQHMFMKTQEYGKVLWKIEVFSQAGTVFCYDFETLIEEEK